MIEDREDQLLKHCPWCDYNLTGLPVEHICPECGHPINRRSIVIGRHGVSRRKLILTSMFYTTLPYVIMIALGWLMGIAVFRPAFIAFMASCLGVTLFVSMIRSNSAYRIHVTGDGLIVEHLVGRTEIVPWHRVKSADRGWNKRILKVLLVDRSRRLFVECSSARPEDVKTCIRAINTKAAESTTSESGYADRA